MVARLSGQMKTDCMTPSCGLVISIKLFDSLMIHIDLNHLYNARSQNSWIHIGV